MGGHRRILGRCQDHTRGQSHALQLQPLHVQKAIQVNFTRIVLHQCQPSSVSQLLLKGEESDQGME